ncbi:MAG: hypothetical protein ACT4OH_07630 [Methylophilaceae bacterium]
MKQTVLILALLSTQAVFAEAPALDCKAGPASKNFGGSAWLVYGCNDNNSVVAVSAPGSPAMPFYFIFSYSAGSYQLHGEGTGNKAATDAAYKELSAFKQEDIVGLLKAAQNAK